PGGQNRQPGVVRRLFPGAGHGHAGPVAQFPQGGRLASGPNHSATGPRWREKIMRYVSIVAVLAAVTGLAVFLAGDRPVEAADKAKWGTIKGKVIFDGKPPAPGEVVGLKGHMDEKHCRSEGDLVTEDWVVDPKTNGVQWVLVWLAPDADSGQETLP